MQFTRMCHCPQGQEFSRVASGLPEGATCSIRSCRKYDSPFENPLPAGQLMNAVVGKQISIDELLGELNACYVGTGAGLPRCMGIEGECLNGVSSANKFLTRLNLMRAYRFPEYDTLARVPRGCSGGATWLWTLRGPRSVWAPTRW